MGKRGPKSKAEQQAIFQAAVDRLNAMTAAENAAVNRDHMYIVRCVYSDQYSSVNAFVGVFTDKDLADAYVAHRMDYTLVVDKVPLNKI